MGCEIPTGLSVRTCTMMLARAVTFCGGVLTFLPLMDMYFPSQRMTSCPVVVRMVKSSPDKDTRSFITRKVGACAT